MKNHGAFNNVHERALRLIDKQPVEGLAQVESLWLEEHLSACKACTARVATTEAAVRAVKSVSVALPRGLAASTTLKVREEAEKLKLRRVRNVALIAGCTVSWVAGVASAPLVWRVCEWFGSTLDLPRVVWELGFLSWWLVPAASAGLVILWVSAKSQRDELNGRIETGPRWIS
jgi:anti-sigma factor RsiW